MATSPLIHSLTLITMLCLAQQRNSPMRMLEDEKPSFPSITVTGVGKIAARPDIADIGVGVVTQAATAKKALDANNTAMDRLHGIFRERGVAAKDIRTSQIEISPVYSQPQPQTAAFSSSPPPSVASAPRAPREFIPRIVGYRVTNSVQITARQIDKLGPLLDAAVEGGANQINGISFRVEHPDQLLDEARKRAMADAKRKAELLAGESGMVVGIPWKIEESAGDGQPRWRVGFEFEVAAAPAPSMPVAPGEQEFSVAITVVYELKNPK